MKAKIRRIVTIYVAANAMTFAALLLIFLVLLFLIGSERAERIWSVPIYTVGFLLSLVVSAKFIKS
jgi:predicted membrane channel-forming protein YqfA (hemolysin III family)